MELPPFGLAEIVSQWQFAPVVTGFVVLAAGLYLWGVLRYGGVIRRGRGRCTGPRCSSAA